MNPFTAAKLAGHTAQDVLKYLSKTDSNIAKMIARALGAGYAADEVMNYLGKATDGSFSESKKSDPRYGASYSRTMRVMNERVPESVKQSRAERGDVNEQLGGILDAGNLIGAGLGAAAGSATGLGPIAGGLGGIASWQEIQKRYKKHQQEGGQLSLQDFIASLAKGAGLAFGGSKVQDMLGGQAADPGEPAQLPPPPVDGKLASENVENPVPEIAQGIDTQLPIAQEPQAKVLDKEAAYKDITSLFNAPIVDTIAGGSNDTIDLISGLNRLDEKKSKLIGKRSGLTQEEALQGALDYVKSRRDTQNAVKPEVQELVKPEEAQQPISAVQAVSLAPIAQEAQAELVQPETEPKKQGKLGTKSDVKPLYMTDGDESFVADVFHNVFDPDKIERKPSAVKGKLTPLKIALKSSNVRGARLNPDTGKMRVVFAARKNRKGGTVYEYDNVDLDTFKKMTNGEARPITEGSNEYGIWFNEKDPSVGAAFSKHIRSNPEDFPFVPIEESGKSVEEKQIVQSDRAFQATRLFAPFLKVQERGRTKNTGKALKERVKDAFPVVKGMDEEFMADLVEFLEEKINLKNPPTLTRLEKEFKKRF